MLSRFAPERKEPGELIVTRAEGAQKRFKLFFDHARGTIELLSKRKIPESQDPYFLFLADREQEPHPEEHLGGHDLAHHLKRQTIDTTTFDTMCDSFNHYYATDPISGEQRRLRGNLL